MKSRRSKACDISQKVKHEVWERDGERCVLCGSHVAMPNAHYIPRSQGGLGVPENVVTLCRECHYKFDFTDEAETIGEKIRSYLMNNYPDWNEEALVYRKYDW